MKKNRRSWVLIIFLACGTAFWAILWLVLPPGEKPEEPKVTLQNISPCIEPDWKRVEKIVEGDTQWICADMRTNRSSIDLGLDIFNSEDGKSVYSDYSEVSSGRIALIIYPPLPSGKYKARITGFRGPTFASFEFEVVKNSNK